MAAVSFYSCCSQQGDGAKEAQPASFVRRAFSSQLASTIVCGHCQHVSCTIEEFMDISVEICQPQPEELAAM